MVDSVYLKAQLSIAEQNALVGTRTPPMLRFRQPVRWLARIISRVVLYLAQVVTIHQRQFNESILHALKCSAEVFPKLQSRIGRHRDMIEELRLVVAAQKNRIATFEKDLADRNERLAEMEGELGCLKAVLQQVEKAVWKMRTSQGLLENQPNSIDLKTETDILSEVIEDSLYAAFEDQFRGSFEEIKERSKVYLPLVREAEAGLQDRPILDLGCGRGEWLQLLKNEKLQGLGVDINADFVQRCRRQNLTVSLGDAVDFLRNSSKESFGAVTGFHLIEHLPWDLALELIAETLRVLKPGGIAIFETPNPQNLLVGACDFWSDPTHMRPLHPQTQQFTMERLGFTRVSLMFLHPVDEDQRLPEPEAPHLAQQLNDFLACDRDYAVIGYKP